MPRPQSVKAFSNATANDASHRQSGRATARNFGVTLSKIPCFSASALKGSRKLRTASTASFDAAVDQFWGDFNNERTYATELRSLGETYARDAFEAEETQALALVEHDVTKRKAEADYEAALARQLVTKLKPYVGSDFTAFQYQQLLLIIENGQKLTTEKSKLAEQEATSNAAAKAIFFESMRQANTAYHNATTAAGIAHALQEQANEQAYRDAMNAATSAYNTALAVANAAYANAISTLASRWQAALEIVSGGGSVPTGFFNPGGNGGSGPVPLSAAKQGGGGSTIPGNPVSQDGGKDPSGLLIDDWLDANRYLHEMDNWEALRLLGAIKDIAENTNLFSRKTEPLDDKPPFASPGEASGFCVAWINNVMHQIERLGGAKRINTQDGLLFLFDDGTAIAIGPEILDYNGWGPIFTSHAVIRIEIGKGWYDENGRFWGEAVNVFYIDNGIYGGSDRILDLPEAQKSLLPYSKNDPTKLFLDETYKTPTMIKRPQTTWLNLW